MTIRGMSLRNRIVVPPMHQYSAVKGFPTDWHLMNAGKFAAGGAGLVVVESTKVERRGCGTVGDLGIWDDAFHRAAEPAGEIHQGAGRGRRYPARPFRPKGARPSALGRRRPAAKHT
jgi:2,4-dienoyl-CoA reductase-like NADH-dependent reductase (Old Yellow Enzyme family)